ncbi:unnamed protein product [Closterium sp. NIES-65]|nr:unnamed protein product [Closterium sp. NIES-65]
MTVARAIASGSRLLLWVVAVILTVSVNASSGGFAVESTVHGGNEFAVHLRTRLCSVESAVHQSAVHLVVKFLMISRQFIHQPRGQVISGAHSFPVLWPILFLFLPVHPFPFLPFPFLPFLPLPSLSFRFLPFLPIHSLSFPFLPFRPLPSLSFPFLPRLPLPSRSSHSFNPAAINGQQSPRSRLVGRVGEFEGQLNYYLPQRFRTHPERVDLLTRPLGFPINTSRLPGVLLGYYENVSFYKCVLRNLTSYPNQLAVSGDASGDDSSVGSRDVPGFNSGYSSRANRTGVSSTSVGGVVIDLVEWALPQLRCHGPPCPSFGSCTARFPNVQACWNPHLVDGPADEIVPPINCPLKGDSAGQDKRTHMVPFDESCSHKGDFKKHGASALQMMRLEDVYVMDIGIVLNRTHLFLRSGCTGFPGTVTYDVGHVVHELSTPVFNWAYRVGDNFYHFLMELFPLFLVAAPLMPSTLRHLPVLARSRQVRMYEKLGVPLIGIPLDSIRLLPTFDNDLFHAKVVYQPIYQDCQYPSRSLWQMMRRRHLLHPSGIPLFNPDWTYRSHRPLSAHEARSLPPDWVVVLAKRLERKPRAMLNFGEVEAEVVRRFGRERVVVFDGSLPILQARVLFLRARLYIASHGAGFTNMIFMPEKASVLEIRPHRCPTHVFNGLAAACSLRYHLVFSQGVCSSSVVANVTSVARVLVAVQAKFQAEDGGGEGRGPNTIFSRT